MLREPIVETTNGKLRGGVDNGVHVFKGVRYARTTAGTNRFMPPRPAEKWSGIRDALCPGFSAPQLPVQENTDPFYSWYGEIQPISEDCLFLNVFTPGLDDASRPIMLWIHGGGWREFSGTAAGFNGRNLAQAQDVVVVAVNHRLTCFGFLYLEGSQGRFADSGNAGLLDIVGALRWVRDNARAFGGDPNNVTIFGESGGASKIAAILAMPAANDLFHKAILQSGAGGMRLASPEEAARHSADLAKALGNDRLDGDELQKLPMEALLSALKSVRGPFRGMIDGRSFGADPFYPSAPAISADVPIMVGYTNTETTYHLRFYPANFSLQYSDVKRRLMRFLEIEAPQAVELVDAYRGAYPEYGASEILAMITSDFVFKRNAIRLASLQAASAGASVYVYQFNRETPIEGGRMHCPHTSEVPFIFGTTSAAEAHVGRGSDIEPLTECMMATWASFARYGSPSNATVPEWKPFTGTDRQTMMLDVESRLEVDPGGQPRRLLELLPHFGYSYSLQKIVTE